METAYEEEALRELEIWQRKMLKSPSLLDNVTRKMQVKLNNLIPEKIHKAITAAIKQMIRLLYLVLKSPPLNLFITIA